VRRLALALVVVGCGGDPGPAIGDATSSSGGAGPGTDTGTGTVGSASSGGDDESSAGDGGSGEGTTGGDDDPAPDFTPEEWAALQALAPDPLPSPPVDPTNAWADDASAAAFGQRLFFTPIFSGRLLDGDQNGMGYSLGNKGDTGKVACTSCHVPADGFSDTRSPSQQISLGAGWGRRRAPSLLDVGHTRLLMWDGRHDAMYNQVFGPIESAAEMNSSRLFAAQQVFANFREEYEAIFGAMPPLDDLGRFPALSAELTGCTPLDGQAPLVCDGEIHGSPGDGAEFDGMTVEDRELVTRVVVNVGKAIGAYERLLSCGPGRFDAWIHGDESATSNAEKRGAKLFVGAAGCVGCHDGPFMSDQEFHNVGLVPALVAASFIDTGDRGAAVGLGLAIEDPLNTAGVFSDGDDGRLPAVVEPAHEGAFRTPGLRCVAQRPSLFHTGQALGLAPVVAFFDRGGDLPGGYPGISEIAPLGLSAGERADLVAFLQSLDGPGPSAELLVAPQ
jgi:cytochrome c peroxidase